MSGATSASGPRTKKRSRNRGCGTSRPGSIAICSAVEDQVEVEGPCRIQAGTLASELMLDLEKRIEQLPRRKVGLPYRHRIQVEVLVLRAFTHRPGLDDVGEDDVVEKRGEAGGSESNGRVAVT